MGTARTHGCVVHIVVHCTLLLVRVDCIGFDVFGNVLLVEIEVSLPNRSRS